MVDSSEWVKVPIPECKAWMMSGRFCDARHKSSVRDRKMVSQETVGDYFLQRWRPTRVLQPGVLKRGVGTR